MKYAESLLLCGQLISADEVDKDSYSELSPVCPHSKKKVRLVSYPGLTQFEGDKESEIFTWVHSEEISIPESSECNEKNKYYESKKDIVNGIARSFRLSLLRPHIWELILSSVILDNPHGLQYYDDSEDDRLMMWFDQHFATLCHSPSYQVRIKQECENLYELCIKETIKDGNSQLFKKIAEIYSNYNHVVYGQQIAGEVLLHVLSTWESSDIHKLIYLAVNEEVCHAARKFSYVMSEIVRDMLKQSKRAEFMNLWVEDKSLGMDVIVELSKKFPRFTEIFKSGLATIDVMFSINLCLIFSCVPWIEKLKKIN
ncbi:MAG: hypothetical protein F6K24_02430 [Okeania sp. SIO2D1]|nr:hypothetical protein [Okeania sp. SIO2D1]